MRQAIAVLIVLGIATSAFADVRTSAEREGVKAGAQAHKNSTTQARPNVKGEDRGLGWALIGGGATVFVLGLVTGDAECTIAQFGPVCENTSNKALVLVGAGLVGAGGFVLYKGRSSPQIVVGPRALGVRKQVGW